MTNSLRRNMMLGAFLMGITQAVVFVPRFYKSKSLISRPDTEIFISFPTDIVLGNGSTVIVEYASLTCPHCAKFMRDIFPQIQDEFINTGKVTWIYRDLMTDGAALAAALMIRLLPKDKQFEGIKTLFAHQSDWGVQANLISHNLLNTQNGPSRGLEFRQKLAAVLAPILKVDITTAIAQMGNQVAINALKEADRPAIDQKIKATPTFYIKDATTFSGEREIDYWRSILK